MNPVVHFEMSYENAERIARFYESAFGWQTQHLPEMGNYVLANTTATGEDGRPMTPGAINGGFYDRSDASVGREPSVVIAVDDLDTSIRKVRDAGGNTLGEPFDIPQVGRYVAIADTEGNRVGVLQPSPM
jgi:uncharacterized protein